MPFVPLGRRKPLVPVLLDHDKEQMAAEQRAIDDHTVAMHRAHAPSNAGYRFGRHAATMGPVRGPEMPFKGASSPWQPPEADPQGPAGQRAKGHASHGGYWEASHGLRTMRSAPSLYNTGEEMMGKKSVLDVTELTHPLSQELKRWQGFGEFSKTEMKADMVFEDHRRPPAKPMVVTPGLVNFPKYLLINNCHLKSQDQMRFVEKEAAKRAAAEAEAEARREAELSGVPFGDDLAAGSTHSSRLEKPSSPVKYGQPSWGAPKLRNAAPDSGPHWAGSALPGGRAARTSNPFRMG